MKKEEEYTCHDSYSNGHSLRGAICPCSSWTPKLQEKIQDQPDLVEWSEPPALQPSMSSKEIISTDSHQCEGQTVLMSRRLTQQHTLHHIPCHKDRSSCSPPQSHKQSPPGTDWTHNLVMNPVSCTSKREHGAWAARMVSLWRVGVKWF